MQPQQLSFQTLTLKTSRIYGLKSQKLRFVESNQLLFQIDQEKCLFFLSTIKELTFSHKLWFSNPYIFATRCCRILIFQTINSVISNTPSGCKDIGIRKFKFVANQFLYKLLLWSNDILMVLIKYSQNMHTHNQTIWSEFCQLRFLDLCDICKKKFQIWDSAVGDSRSSIVQILSKIIMQTFVQKPRLGMNIYICMLSIVCGYIK